MGESNGDTILMPKTEEQLMQTDECYVLLPGSSGGLHHPLMKLLYDEHVARGFSVLSMEYPYQTRGDVPSVGLVEEIESLKQVFDYLAQKNYKTFRIVGKSIGGRVALMYVGQSHDERIASIDIFGFTMVKNDPEKVMAQATKDKLRVVVQGELDEFAAPSEVSEYLQPVSSDIKVLAISQADHSYRHNGSRELPTHEKEAVELYFSKLADIS